jgi:hypothetical protein
MNPELLVQPSKVAPEKLCTCGAACLLTSSALESELSATSKLRWMEVDSLCNQTLEAGEELCKITDNSSLSVQAVIKTAFYEGKTLHLSYILPAHSLIVQALLNMSPVSIKRLYIISKTIPGDTHLKLRHVASNQLNPILLNMTVDSFKFTVELLYYMKEYFLSLFGTALVNVTCQDKAAVLIILSQVTLTCNLCDNTASSTRLFQCVDCNVSSVCIECMQTDKGREYLQAHSVCCNSIQRLIRPIVETMTFAHLCEHCYAPLHKNCVKNHFNPHIMFQLKKQKRFIKYNKAQCSFPKCKRSLCVTCLRNSHKKCSYKE